MNLTGNAEVNTGGASGIGHAPAAAALETGNEAKICGRDRDKLEPAREAHAGLAVVGCDLAREVVAGLAAKRHEIRPGIDRLVFSSHRPAPALPGRKMRRA